MNIYWTTIYFFERLTVHFCHCDDKKNPFLSFLSFRWQSVIMVIMIKTINYFRKHRHNKTVQEPFPPWEDRLSYIMGQLSYIMEQLIVLVEARGIEPLFSYLTSRFINCQAFTPPDGQSIVIPFQKQSSLWFLWIYVKMNKSRIYTYPLKSVVNSPFDNEKSCLTRECLNINRQSFQVSRVNFATDFLVMLFASATR